VSGYVKCSAQFSIQIALEFARVQAGAHTPVVPTDPEGYESTLRSIVHRRIERLGYTFTEAHEITGLSTTTLRNLGEFDKRDTDGTLKKLTLLGLQMKALTQARYADDQARGDVDSEWSPRIHRLAAHASQLGDDDQALLIRIVQAIDDHRAG
jgi:hypothetical protein